jgi:hypothetical protein
MPIIAKKRYNQPLTSTGQKDLFIENSAPEGAKWWLQATVVGFQEVKFRTEHNLTKARAMALGTHLVHLTGNITVMLNHTKEGV